MSSSSEEVTRGGISTREKNACTINADYENTVCLVKGEGVTWLELGAGGRTDHSLP